MRTRFVTLGRYLHLVAEFGDDSGEGVRAFYEAVLRRYGPKKAGRRRQGWIEELETMDWPVDGGLQTVDM